MSKYIRQRITPIKGRSESLFQANYDLPEFPLFDCHVHIGSSDTDELFYPTLSGEEYLAIMESSNLEKACAFPPLVLNGYKSSNASLVRFCNSSSYSILPFARLGGKSVPLVSFSKSSFLRQIRYGLKSRASDIDDLKYYSGIKLLPHLDGMPSDDEFQMISELSLPVIIHGGIHCKPFWIEKHILPRLSGVVIIAHLGAFPCGEKELKEAVELARRHERVYLDTSAAWMSEFIRFAVDHVPEKIIFGSDCPAVHPLVAWHHVTSVVYQDKYLERIGRNNALDIFHAPQKIDIANISDE